MIEIKTKEDVELLKEIAKTFNMTETKGDSDIKEVLQTIEEYNKMMEEMISVNQDIAKSYAKTLTKLSALENRVDDLKPQKKVKTSVEMKKEQVSKHRPQMQKTDLFVPYDRSQKLYNTIYLDGIRLIHNSYNNQEYTLPLNVFELIVVLEAYKLKSPGIFVSEVDKFCKLFSINKMQFSKIYYNLLEGKFDGVLAEVDEMITNSKFKTYNGFIIRNGKNTNISIYEFKEMVKSYKGSNNPFFTIYKFIKESVDYNAFDIFCMLRRKDDILKQIGG